MSEEGIFEAVRRGNLAWIRKLFKKGASAQTRGEDGVTPLMVAVSERKKDVVKFLLEQGADVNAKDFGGDSVLFHALFHDDAGADKEIVELLACHGVDIDAKDGTGKTALAISSVLGDTETGQWLVSKGANIDEQDRELKTPLFLSLSEEKTDMLSFLVGAGADPNIPDDDGQLPIFRAAAKNNPQAVSLLIEAGSDLWHIDRDNNTLLSVVNKTDHGEVWGILCDSIVATMVAAGNGHMKGKSK